MMQAGKLRHRVVIQQASVTQDDYGQESKTWSTFATRWAAVEPQSGQDFVQSNRNEVTVSYRIRIRHTPGVTSKMRVSWDNRIFRIEYLTDVMERDREMHLFCTKETNG